MKRLGYVAGLDGLRGIAIALVVGRHGFLWPIGGGFGVDVFFVLSGFLITTLLLEEHEETGRISFRAFYMRRVRRLFPGLAAMLIVFLVVESVLGRAHHAFVSVAASGFYVANIVDAFWPHVIGREGVGPLWSLAQEEQFYLLAPVALAIALNRARPATIRRVLVLLLAVIILARTAANGAGVSEWVLYYGPVHVDGLVAGMLLAFAVRDGMTPRKWFGVASAALLTLLIFHPLRLVEQEPLISLASAGLILTALNGSRVLCWRPLVFTGKISYSLYLWNGVIFVWLFGDANGVNFGEHYLRIAAVGDVVLAVLISYVSYRFVEQRFRRRSPRMPMVPPQPAAAIVNP